MRTASGSQGAGFGQNHLKQKVRSHEASGSMGGGIMAKFFVESLAKIIQDRQGVAFKNLGVDSDRRIDIKDVVGFIPKGLGPFGHAVAGSCADEDFHIEVHFFGLPPEQNGVFHVAGGDDHVRILGL